MSKNKKLAYRQYLHYLFLIVGLIYGCASARAPEGGPKDIEPPKVLKMEPKNQSVNFNAKKITIFFDEYIKIQEQAKEFSISPELERAPILKDKLRTLEISLPDSLEKNTTYTLNFGKSIADINEGNAIKNFTYVFSTGPTIDSLSIAGNVKNILTGAAELDAVVFILPLERDTLFGKKKPSIYTRTDSSGNYKLNNLKKGDYRIYALKETNGDKIYQQSTDEIGYLKNPIQLSSNLSNIDLGIFKELASTFRIIDRRLNTDGSITMSFNQQLIKPEITVVDPVAIDLNKKVQFNATNDSVKVWLNDFNFDSVKVAIKQEGKVLETIKFTRGKKETYNRVIQVGDNTSAGFLNPNNDLLLNFNFPIQNIDLSKVTLLEDSIPRKGFTLTKDSSNLLAYRLKYPWKKKDEYILNIGEGAVTAIFNTKNKEIIKTFKLGNADDYGTLTLEVKVPDTSKNYIVQLVNEKKDAVIAHQQVSKDKALRFANYRNGIYFVRVIYDENKNGIWDTGNVAKGLQPEKIWYPELDASIRANWEQIKPLVIPPPTP